MKKKIVCLLMVVCAAFIAYGIRFIYVTNEETNPLKALSLMTGMAFAVCILISFLVRVANHGERIRGLEWGCIITFCIAMCATKQMVHAEDNTLTAFWEIIVAAILWALLREYYIRRQQD